MFEKIQEIVRKNVYRIDHIMLMNQEKHQTNYHTRVGKFEENQEDNGQLYREGAINQRFVTHAQVTRNCFLEKSQHHFSQGYREISSQSGNL